MRFLGYTLANEAETADRAPVARAVREDGQVRRRGDQGGRHRRHRRHRPHRPRASIITLKDGEFTVVDGPFTEAKELVGGWALHGVPRSARGRRVVQALPRRARRGRGPRPPGLGLTGRRLGRVRSAWWLNRWRAGHRFDRRDRGRLPDRVPAGGGRPGRLRRRYRPGRGAGPGRARRRAAPVAPRRHARATPAPGSPRWASARRSTASAATARWPPSTPSSGASSSRRSRCRRTTRTSTRTSPEEIADDRLRLIFVACHPVLSVPARVALTLRLVGGLTVPEIARAYVVPEATIAQRIVRAKKTIAKAGVPFEVPVGEDRAARLGAVLEVIYLIFNEGYSATAGETGCGPSSATKRSDSAACWPRSRPTSPRSTASSPSWSSSPPACAPAPVRRVTPVLLLDQDRRTWDRLHIGRGEAALARADAARATTAGPYTLQAAIAACHARAVPARETDWDELVALYSAARPGDAVADRRAEPRRRRLHGLRARRRARPGGPSRRDGTLERYHLLSSVRGDLLDQLGRHAEAAVEFDRAAGAGHQRRRSAPCSEAPGPRQPRHAGDRLVVGRHGRRARTEPARPLGLGAPPGSQLQPRRRQRPVDQDGRGPGAGSAAPRAAAAGAAPWSTSSSAGPSGPGSPRDGRPPRRR